MLYQIYQLKDARKTEYGFMGWSFAAQHGFKMDDYVKVYSGEIDQEDCLEHLYEMFNINHPLDFRGHSLSISDVVALKKDENDYWYWYYCDRFGWEEITDKIEKRELQNVSWFERAFLADIKQHLLYEDNEHLIAELADGSALRADIERDGDCIYLSIGYCRTVHSLPIINISLVWFPEDEELARAIHLVYETSNKEK